MTRSKKFTLRFLLDLYDAFLRTPDLIKVSEALNLPAANGTLCAWIKRYPDLKMVKDLADERRQKQDTLPHYILGKLSPEARAIWNELAFWKDGDVPGRITERIDKRLRKELFFHALINCSYNISRACELVGLGRQTMRAWQEEPEFIELMKVIQIHKKDFFENALMDLVEVRYPGAVMFVNRTINADRGYSEKVTVEHTGQVMVGIDVSQLDLDLETRRKILEAVRRKKEMDWKGKGQIVDLEPARMLSAPVGETEHEDAL